MRLILILLFIIPSLSWGNHEVLNCEDGLNYSFSKDHTILTINNSDGTIDSFNIVNSNEVWAYFQSFEDEYRFRSFNKYTKAIVVPNFGYYECQVFESD